MYTTMLCEAEWTDLYFQFFISKFIPKEKNEITVILFLPALTNH
jgi:hypothetical protein